MEALFLVTIGQFDRIKDRIYHDDIQVYKLYSLNSFLKHPLKFLFSPLGQLDFYIIQKSDGSFVVVLVMNNVIEVDKE